MLFIEAAFTAIQMLSIKTGPDSGNQGTESRLRNQKLKFSDEKLSKKHQK
jgi:hypothetical protein